MSEPYRPSNGTEGEFFQEKFCQRCVKDRACNKPNPDWSEGCKILAATFANDIDDPDYPKEWIEDDEGARCTAFEEDFGQKYPDPHTLTEAERAAQLPLIDEQRTI